MLVVPYKGKTWVPPEALFFAATGLMGFTGGRGCCCLLAAVRDDARQACSARADTRAMATISIGMYRQQPLAPACRLPPSPAHTLRGLDALPCPFAWFPHPAGPSCRPPSLPCPLPFALCPLPLPPAVVLNQASIETVFSKKLSQYADVVGDNVGKLMGAYFMAVSGEGWLRGKLKLTG